MKNLPNRVNKLEAMLGIRQRMKYLCVIYDGLFAESLRREVGEVDKGYKIQPFDSLSDRYSGEPFYLKTEQELDEFAARPDVELIIMRLVNDGK